MNLYHQNLNAESNAVCGFKSVATVSAYVYPIVYHYLQFLRPNLRPAVNFSLSFLRVVPF